MRPPPSRYKVVERGRRLEVIDTLTGQPATRSLAPPRADNGARFEGAGVSDGASFTTRPWYDEKAPRRIATNFTTRKKIDQLRMGIAIAVALLIAFLFLFWPLSPALLVAAAFALPKMRGKLRAAATRFIDGLDQAA